MRTHVTILGCIYIGVSLLYAVIGIVIFLFVAGGGALSGDRDAIAITGTVGGILMALFLLLALPGLIGGIGILNYRPWARILILILSFFQLFSFPVGTALGIYAYWVLLNDETNALFANPQRL